MTIRIGAGAAPSRRRFLSSACAAAAATAIDGVARPHLSFAADRPRITHGVQSDDVSVESGVVWARADRPARMLVEVATSESFREILHSAYIDVLAESDFTGKLLLEDLPPGQDIFYHIRFQNLSSPAIIGAPQIGRFRTAPADRKPVSFVWSGDTAGCGWGIDLARGGMRTYATMLANRPDFFIHCGDIIYADCPIGAQYKLPNGEVWRNVVTAEKSKVAETLNEFRGNYKYNLLDANLRAFNAEVPIFAQWDDHEVTDDWIPGGAVRRDGGYRENSLLKHDEFLREYCGTHFGGIEVAETAIHVGADGRRYLVMHGDQFDLVVTQARWLAMLGGKAYDYAIVANRLLNQFRRRLGFPYWSLSQWAKLKVKKAVSYIGAFEKALVLEAERQDAHGVVCGHIHHAAIHDEFGVRYLNCGDWVESCTALAEHHDGRFEIVRWTDRLGYPSLAPTRAERQKLSSGSLRG